MIEFINLEHSNKPTKKLKLTLNINGSNRTIHFGAKNSKTYLDHYDIVKRENYLKRHKALGEDWDIIGPASLSALVLWGPTTDLHQNLMYYFDKFNISY